MRYLYARNRRVFSHHMKNPVCVLKSQMQFLSSINILTALFKQDQCGHNALSTFANEHLYLEIFKSEKHCSKPPGRLY